MGKQEREKREAKEEKEAKKKAKKEAKKAERKASCCCGSGNAVEKYRAVVVEEEEPLTPSTANARAQAHGLRSKNKLSWEHRDSLAFRTYTGGDRAA
jgi:hypothetical protein